MMKKITFLIPVISLFLFSCGDNSSHKSIDPTEIISHDAHQHNTEMQTIELNNGNKWKVDNNMITHIRNMEKVVQTFKTTENENYKLLAEELQNHIKLLTSNCTMKGKAHDELHKWLLPYIDRVDELSVAEDHTEVAKQFENIKHSFTTFNQYFQ